MISIQKKKNRDEKESAASAAGLENYPPRLNFYTSSLNHDFTINLNIL